MGEVAAVEPVQVEEYKKPTPRIVMPWEGRLWKGVIYGNSGTRKSFFAASMITTIYKQTGQPGKVFMFDPFGKENPYLIQGLAGGLQEVEDGGFFQYVFDKEKPKQVMIEIEYFADMMPQTLDKQKNLSAYERFQISLEDHVNNKWEGYASVVMDSYSFYEESVLRLNQYKLNPTAKSGAIQDGKQWYGAARRASANDVVSTLAWAPRHVCVIAHVDRSRVDLQDKQAWGIDAAGQGSGAIPRAFAECYFFYKEKDQVRVMTDSDGTYIAHSHIQAPNPCAATWEALWQK